MERKADISAEEVALMLLVLCDLRADKPEAELAWDGIMLVGSAVFLNESIGAAEALAMPYARATTAKLSMSLLRIALFSPLSLRCKRALAVQKTLAPNEGEFRQIHGLPQDSISRKRRYREAKCGLQIPIAGLLTTQVQLASCRKLRSNNQ